MTSFHEKKYKKNFTLFFTQQISTLIDSKIPVLQALIIIQSQNHPQSFKTLLNVIISDLHNGQPFSQSLSSHPRFFNTLYCATIEAGESSNSLTESFHLLLSQLRIKKQLSEKVRQSLRYPIFMLSCSLTISYLLITTVLPKFTDLFNSFNQDIPQFSLWVMMISKGASASLPFILIITSMLITLIAIGYKKSGRFRKQLMLFVTSLPLLKRIIPLKQESLLLIILGHLLSRKIDLYHALIICLHSTNSDAVRQKIIETTNLIHQGKSLSESLRLSKLFTHQTVLMIDASSQSTSQSQLLCDIGLRMQNEFINIIENYQRMIEPIVILGLSVIIGSVIMAIYLPLFNMGNIV